jgi:hypothetical protein
MRLLTLFCAGLATLALALSYAGQALWAGAGLCIAIGLLWLGGQWRGADWVAEPCLAGCAGLAAFGAWQERPAGWMLLGVVAALAAWDLGHFAGRLRRAGHVAQRPELIRAHLRQLTIVVAIGALLGAFALGLRIELTFGWALVVAGLAIYSLSRLIGAGRGADR